MTTQLSGDWLQFGYIGQPRPMTSRSASAKEKARKSGRGYEFYKSGAHGIRTEKPLQGCDDRGDAAKELRTRGRSPIIPSPKGAVIRTQIIRMIKRAGLKPWPKPLQNLHSTRETTDRREKFPAHVVCGWIGNSEAIALKHYLQVTDDHFERAVRGEAEIGPEVTPTVTNTPANATAQKVARYAHA